MALSCLHRRREAARCCRTVPKSGHLGLRRAGARRRTWCILHRRAVLSLLLAPVGTANHSLSCLQYNGREWSSTANRLIEANRPAASIFDMGGPLLRLGLDLGTNSIGWALFRLNGENPPEPIQLVAGGVLVHSDGRNPKNQASNAATRRQKRGPRRSRDRAIMRQTRVANLLDGLGLLPRDDDERMAVRNLDPLRLRSEGLDRPLAPHELGRVLLSLANRRGFKSNRRADDGDDGAIRKDAGELRRRMAQAGARTLGDYLWRRRRKGKTIHARLGNGLYPDREMIEHELRSIRERQAPHHAELVEEDWEELLGTLLYQRQLVRPDRGRCTLLPHEPRAFRAYPLFQEFRIWQDVLNIQIAYPGDRFRPMGPEDRQRIVERLKSTRRQDLDRVAPDGARVNLATSARKILDGDLTAAVLGHRDRFGKQNWAAFGIDRQQQVVERLLEAEDHEEVVAWLKDEFSVGDSAAEKVATASLPPGTAHLSKAAIERLLPHMRRGALYHEAVEAAGLGSHSDKRGDGKADYLPYYGAVLDRHVIGGRPKGRNDVERYGRIANPTVHIALGQVRRLFNAIVDRYGKPHEVVVELARALKQSREERERDEETIRQNRERNDRVRQCAVDAGFHSPSSSDMHKLRLWDEQGPPDARVCPFTGETLSIGRVLSAETEVEHILPYSLSLDDSMANTVLSMRRANREKGARTPHEAWGGDHARYQQILGRARLLPPNKQWRFEADAMKRLDERGGFLARQLNDTRYLSRVTRDYLQTAVHPDRIWVTPGRQTSMLRYAWGLNTLLADGGGKNRDDHRHHLIDAVVVGMTSRSLLQRVAKYSAHAVDDLGGRVAKAAKDLPWIGFREEVKALVERTVVRHRPDHFTIRVDKRERRRTGNDVTTGALHNETAYGIVSGPDADGLMTLVATKPVESLVPKGIEDVRDQTLRQELRELWRAVDQTDQKPLEKRAEFGRAAQRRYGVRRVRILERARYDSLAIIKDHSGRGYKAYRTDGNAFMDVWLLPDGKVVGETVTRFAAHQAAFRSSVKSDHPTARKVMRLHINDMIAIGAGGERRILRVQGLSGQEIAAVDHNEGGDIRKRRLDRDHPHPYRPLRRRPHALVAAGVRRVSVSILGEIRDGGPVRTHAPDQSQWNAV